MTFSRFDRQTSLPGMDQRRLADSSALVIGAGGLGSPVIIYLAGAGLGRVDVCDDDSVEETNIHRQTLYTNNDIGQKKAYVAAHRVIDVGAESLAICSKFCDPDPGTRRSTASVATKYSIILDCTDRWSSHDAVISAGLSAGVPVVHGSIQGLLGRVIVFRPGGACWRCLHPERPSGTKDGPQGTLGPVCGVVGSMMALEALKVLLEWEGLKDTMAVYDGMAVKVSHFAMPKDPACANHGGAHEAEV